MGQISVWVGEYVAGGLTYQQLRDRLAGFDFGDPWAQSADESMTVVERNAALDDSVPDVEDTLLELRATTVKLGLPWDVYRRLRSDLARPQ